ncbi:MAG: hypothetical protein U0359_02620 [Byssovorax sp.]
MIGVGAGGDLDGAGDAGERDEVGVAVLPLPSWPLLLSPQHMASPLASMAQVCVSPHAISGTPEMPTTATGEAVGARVVAEVAPAGVAAPRHLTVESRRAQAWNWPALTATALLMPVTLTRGSALRGGGVAEAGP